jgi:hypothetical protein
MKVNFAIVGANDTMRKVLIEVFGLQSGFTPYPITNYTYEQMLKVANEADSVQLIHHFDEESTVSIGYKFGDHTIAFLLKDVKSTKK